MRRYRRYNRGVRFGVEADLEGGYQKLKTAWKGLADSRSPLNLAHAIIRKYAMENRNDSKAKVAFEMIHELQKETFKVESAYIRTLKLLEEMRREY